VPRRQTVVPLWTTHSTILIITSPLHCEKEVAGFGHELSRVASDGRPQVSWAGKNSGPIIVMPLEIPVNRRWPLLPSALSFIAAIVGAAAEPTTRPLASSQPATQPAPSTRPARDPAAIAREIDAIIYSELTKDQMLQRLKPFVALMDSKDDFRKKTGLEFEGGFGSGPGVMDYSVMNCGLRLVVDPDQKIRIIRRDGKLVNGKIYPRMSISEPGFKWNNYARWYPE